MKAAEETFSSYYKREGAEGEGWHMHPNSQAKGLLPNSKYSGELYTKSIDLDKQSLQWLIWAGFSLEIMV